MRKGLGVVIALGATMLLADGAGAQPPTADPGAPRPGSGGGADPPARRSLRDIIGEPSGPGSGGNLDQPVAQGSGGGIQLPGGGSGGGIQPPSGPGSGGGIQPSSPQPSQTQVWGAVSFTSDGSYSTVWKQPSKEVAEAKVATKCAEFGRGSCRTIGFPGELCVALVHFRSRRWRITFPGAGRTYPEAQQAALRTCEEDRRTRARNCKHLTAVCGDGR